MSLITETKKLRELERSPARSLQYFAKLTTDAPAMIDVLESFREGDAAGLHLLIEWLDAMQKSSDWVISPDIMQVLVRLQKAASLMEQEIIT